MTKRQMQSRINTEKRKRMRASKDIDAARKREDYWRRIQDSLEYRLELVAEGQLEMRV